MRVFSDIVYVGISLSNVGVIFRINFASQILSVAALVWGLVRERKKNKKKSQGIAGEWAEAQDTLSV